MAAIVDCSVSGTVVAGGEEYEYLYGADVCDIASAVLSAEQLLSLDHRIEIRDSTPPCKDLRNEPLLAEWMPRQRTWVYHQKNIDRAFAEDE